MFSNIGLGELLLEENGVSVVVANEFIPKRADLYRRIYPETDMVVGDITDKLIFDQFVGKAVDRKVELLIATPPCQGMSTLGRMKENDSRNTLIVKVVEAVQQINPKRCNKSTRSLSSLRMFLKCPEHSSA